MDKIIKKCKDNSGSALILVIFAMIIVTISMFILIKQVSNQVASNKHNEEKIESKYAAEAGIETAISEAMKSIEVHEGVMGSQLQYKIENLNLNFPGNNPYQISNIQGFSYTSNNGNSRSKSMIKIIYPDILNLSWDNTILYNENNKKIEYKLKSIGPMKNKADIDGVQPRQVISIEPGQNTYIDFDVMYSGLVYNDNELEEEYTIKASIQVKVEQVISANNYKLSYDINDWRYTIK